LNKKKIKLLYHSIKLNEEWARQVLKNNESAIGLYNHNDLNDNTWPGNEKKSLKKIGGLGFLEYKLVVNESITKNFGASLDAITELSKYTEAIKTEYTRMVKKISNDTVKNRLELVFISTLENIEEKSTNNVNIPRKKVLIPKKQRQKQPREKKKKRRN